ncbi:MAG: SpoIVB peptidase [Clostridiales bacterium]|nr:SpoIVB peptidase [Clostridiales bacterium]
MQNLFKSLVVFGFVCCTIVFGIIGHGKYALPDDIFVVSGSAPLLPSPYTVDIKEVNCGFEKQTGLSADAKNKTRYEADIKVLNVFPIKSSTVTVTKRTYVVPGGDVFGIRLYTKGVIIARLDSVTTAQGNISPAKAAGLKSGDTILSINGTQISRRSQVSEMIEKSMGEKVVLKILRGGKETDLTMTPAKSTDGKYKLGIWVRDSSAGIGTLTFYDNYTGIFAGLGHAVCDVDTGEILPLSKGEALTARVNGCYKGSHGKPGELCGAFEGDVLGSLTLNGETGIYGEAKSFPCKSEPVPIALSNEVKPGKAQIISNVGNGPQYYDIIITRLCQNADTGLKNMVIKVTDKELISLTGGIVQGMSGSPIIQNNMLVGAVTHVYVNDPLQGYGIFAENMLETVYDIQKDLREKAS